MSSSQVVPKRHRTGYRLDTDVFTVLDLVRWYLPIRELVRSKLVSKEWNKWCNENLLHVAQVRRRDKSPDFYFPISFNSVSCRAPARSWLRTWLGIHRWPSTASQVYKLPPLDFLPNWTSLNAHFNYTVEASSSGLLVLSYMNAFSLLVCNPLRRDLKKLPSEWKHDKEPLNSSHSDVFDPKYKQKGPFQTHIVVDGVSNKYTIIRICKQYVNLYNSSSNSWRCSRNPFYTLDEIGTTACANGKIYICSSASRNITQADMQLCFKMSAFDNKSKEWVQNNITLNVDALICNYHYDLVQLGDEMWHHGPKIVQCKGNLYAVCAAGHCTPCDHPEGQVCKSFEVHFHIFRLQLNRPKGVASLVAVLQVDPQGVIPHNFHSVVCDFYGYTCIARGNLIWLSMLGEGFELSLQHDIVSGLTSTHEYTLLAHDLDMLVVKGSRRFMSYVPNFDVRP